MPLAERSRTDPSLQDNEFVLEFVGKVDGDKLEGVYEMEGRGDIADVIGKKRK